MTPSRNAILAVFAVLMLPLPLAIVELVYQYNRPEPLIWADRPEVEVADALLHAMWAATEDSPRVEISPANLWAVPGVRGSRLLLYARHTATPPRTKSHFDNAMQLAREGRSVSAETPMRGWVFGGHVVRGMGFEEASMAFWGAGVSQLEPAQAAVLVSLSVHPHLLREPDALRQSRNRLLVRMYTLSFIGVDELAIELASPLPGSLFDPLDCPRTEDGET